jgi:Protein of unknown function (DUF1488)
MPLQQGEIVGYDFNRMVVEFTMFDQGKLVPCAISTAALDRLEQNTSVKADGRMDQFIRLRSLIEERAERKFAAGFVESGRRVVLRSEDFQL